MTQPPKLGHEAPGLVWRARKTGWAATWQARSDLVKKGYLPKTVALWTGAEPSVTEALHIATRCQHLQSEMLLSSRGIAPVAFNTFNGTLRSLVNCYQTDPDSSYHKNRYKVRRNRDRMLKRIVTMHQRMSEDEMDKRTIAEIQMLGAIKAWLDCPPERRPTSWALGRMIQEYADQFNTGAQIVPGIGIVEDGIRTWPSHSQP